MDGDFGRRAIALVTAATLFFSPPPGGARAAPPAKPAVDADIAEIIRRAETLLEKLEYERARELLEASVRDPQIRKARAQSKSRLWVLLGRARAELGDTVGTDEAFLQAVMWDRHVKLSKGVSPKIVESLERARANAPLPGELAEPKEEPAAPDPEHPPRPEPVAATGVSGDREPKKASSPERARPAAKGASPSEPGEKKSPPARSAPSKSMGPGLQHRISGEIKAGRTVTLVVAREGLPKGTRLELHMRHAQSAAFKQEPLTQTGTVAIRRITIDRPRIELFVRALKGKQVIAEIGTSADPIVLLAGASPPPLSEAWSVKESRPSLLPTSTGTASAALESAAARSGSAGGSTAGAAGRNAGRTAEGTVAPTVITPVSDGDDTLLWLGLGGGLLVAAGVVVLVVLLSSGRGGDCDAREGFGCTQIEVLPLGSF